MLSKKMIYPITMIRILLGALFVFSSIHKIIDPQSFLYIVEDYQVIPNWMAFFVAMLLPWAEFIAGFAMILGMWIKGSSLIIMGMCISFAYGIGFNLIQGRVIDCGCFGLSPEIEMINWWSFVRAIILICFSTIIFLQNKSIWSIENRIKKIDV